MAPYYYIGARLPLPYFGRLAIAAFHALLSSFLLYRKNTSRIGRQRLSLAIAITAIDFIIPTLFHPEHEIVTAAVVLGWAVGRGPLMEPLNFAQFATVAFLPITPVIEKPSKTPAKGNARQGEVGHGASGAAFHFILKLVCLGFLVAALQTSALPRLAREALYVIGLYLFIAMVMNCVGAVTVGLFNLRVAPHFDQPYFSSSLTDYWSRRWNLNTGYTMRFLVYDPICENRLIKKDEGPPGTVSFRRRAAAVCASFIVSGIFHEFFIIYLRGRVSWYWLGFFSAQGPLLVLESMGRQWFKAKKLRPLPRFVAIPLALTILLILGDLLFFPDIVRMDIPNQVVKNIHDALVPTAIAASAKAKALLGQT